MHITTCSDPSDLGKQHRKYRENKQKVEVKLRCFKPILTSTLGSQPGQKIYKKKEKGIIIHYYQNTMEALMLMYTSITCKCLMGRRLHEFILYPK